MQRTLEKEQLQFKELIVTLGKRVEAYSEIGGSDPEQDYDLAAVVDEAINLDSALKMAVEKAEDFNNREKALTTIQKIIHPRSTSSKMIFCHILNYGPCLVTFTTT